VGPLDELRASWDAAGLGDGLEWTLAQVAFSVGDHATTRTMLTVFLEAGLDPDFPWIWVDQAIAVGDRALAERAITAARVAAAASPRTDADSLTLNAATEDAAVGRLAEADGDTALAKERYDRAWRTFDAYGWDTPAGLVRGWLGRCLVAEGDPESGILHLVAARGLAERIGLAHTLAEIDEALVRARAVPQPAEAAPRLGSTAPADVG
jgi:hypothetical protein